MITKTIKLYDADAYSTNFDASVLSCEKTDKGYAVILDRTLFFPEEGGQSCDTGKIDGVSVDFVSIRDGIIVHTLSQPLEVGSTVHGEIDFSLRYRNMQHHSGEHIVSGIVSKTFGYKNVGFHLGKSDMTMDYDGELTRDDIDVIEQAANVAVYRNIDIIAKYYDCDELADIDYRSKLDLKQDVRIVTIGKYDVCACCAPHVARTGEIGIIKIVDFYRYKGGTRLHALCGLDALADYNKKQDTTYKLMAMLSTKAENLADSVSSLQQLPVKLTAMTKKYCEAAAHAVPADDCGYLHFDENISSGGLRMIANALVAKRRWCAVFEKNGKDSFSFIIASDNISAKEILSTLTEKTGARGGGNDKMVQGSVSASRKDIESALDIHSF